MERQKHVDNCYGDRCYECGLVVNSNLEQYQEIIKERKEHATSRENFSQQERELTNGYLFLNGKEVKFLVSLETIPSASSFFRRALVSFQQNKYLPPLPALLNNRKIFTSKKP